KKQSMSVKVIQIFSLLGIACTAYLLPACDKKYEAQEDQAVVKKKEKSALTFIRNDDCLNCHNIEDKSVGPAYVQVAQRYEADYRTINRMADKIIEGGGGIWGGDQMSK